jgi:S1-C subfamily serine protease
VKEKRDVLEGHYSMCSRYPERIQGTLFSVVIFFMFCLGSVGIGHASALVTTIAKVKESVVGVGTMMPTRSPRASLSGTGFVVADGNYVLTNAHVVSRELDFMGKESLVVFIGRGVNPETRSASIVQLDKEHDLALLKIPGPPLKPLSFGDSDTMQEGEEVAFTGYPIGAVLGLFPVTHRGIISAITPIVIPLDSGRQLTPALIKRLRARYDVFQLDATAYPGNSGSPLYKPATGEVFGILNMVFVKESRETVLQKPSGIAFAIPARYAVDLINKISQD